ncbi:MAG: hypothetical protein U5L09_16975 [Bacteroidales bacterium]|nr:hypothetical protein [Bacteroidales bacterium]
MQKFPDVFALAAAREQDVLLLWQGLGYYSRHATCTGLPGRWWMILTVFSRQL